MKNKKEYIGIVLSILICLLFVFAGVYATTTVGNDVSVGGNLTVDGTASVSDDFYVGNNMIFADVSANTVLSSSSWSILGNLDVDGTASISALTLSGDFTGVRASLSDSLTATDIIRGGILTDGTATLTGGVFTGLSSLTSTLGIFTHASISDDLQIGTITQSDAYDLESLIPAVIVGNDTTEYDTGVFASASSAGIYGNSEGGYGVLGQSDSEVGVYGDSNSGDGVLGYSRSGSGIYGESDSGHGVYGYTNDPNESAIYSDGNFYVNGTASISGDAYFGGVASISSSGIRLDDGVMITTGVASPSGNCGTSGSLFIDKANAGLYICGTDAAWNVK